MILILVLMMSVVWNESCFDGLRKDRNRLSFTRKREREKREETEGGRMRLTRREMIASAGRGG